MGTSRERKTRRGASHLLLGESSWRDSDAFHLREGRARRPDSTATKGAEEDSGGGIPMKPDLFADLLEGVKQGGEYLRGKRKPSRVFRFRPVDIRGMRRKANLSQERFADLLGISAGTLRNWEQGRREPDGPAQRLLQVAKHDLGVVLEAIHPELTASVTKRGRVRRHRAKAGG